MNNISETKSMSHVRIPGVLVVLAASVAIIGCGKKEEPKAVAPAPAPAFL